jgi:hypothetical protein
MTNTVSSIRFTPTCQWMHAEQWLIKYEAAMITTIRLESISVVMSDTPPTKF